MFASPLFFLAAALVAQAMPMPMPSTSSAPLLAVRVLVSPLTFANLPRVSLAVTEENGAHATYAGVSLDAVLVAAGVVHGAAIRGPAVAGSVVVRASDGYRATYALPELDPAFTDRVTILADQRDGAPIAGKEGPYRIIVADEKRHARWVQGVTEIDWLPAP